MHKFNLSLRLFAASPHRGVRVFFPEELMSVVVFLYSRVKDKGKKRKECFAMLLVAELTREKYFSQ